LNSLVIFVVPPLLLQLAFTGGSHHPDKSFIFEEISSLYTVGFPRELP
jgi:hypothetical protein